MFLNRGHTQGLYRSSPEFRVKLKFSQKISDKIFHIIRNEKTVSKTAHARTKLRLGREKKVSVLQHLCLSENGMHQQEPLGNHRRAETLKFVLWHFSWILASSTSSPFLFILFSYSICTTPSHFSWLAQSSR